MYVSPEADNCNRVVEISHNVYLQSKLRLLGKSRSSHFNINFNIEKIHEGVAQSITWLKYIYVNYFSKNYIFRLASLVSRTLLVQFITIWVETLFPIQLCKVRENILFLSKVQVSQLTDFPSIPVLTTQNFRFSFLLETNRENNSPHRGDRQDKT